MSSYEMLRGLNDGSLHLSLMAQPSARALRGLKFELLREYPICVALPATHPLARTRRVELAQIADEPLVIYSRAEYPEYHAMLMELFRKIGRTPRISEECDSVTSLIAAAEIGRGPAIVPSCLAMLAGARLKFVPLHPAPPPVPLGAVFDPHRFAGAAERFLAAARGASANRKPSHGAESKLGRK